MFAKPRYDQLITALYLRGDPYEKSDAVFGVKDSLIVDLKSVADFDGLAEQHGVPPSTRLLKYDFILVSDEEARRLRHQRAEEALETLNLPGVMVVDGALVPECD